MTADQQKLQVTDQQIEEEDDWDIHTDTMKVTVEALALCAESIIPLHKYDTVKLQYWKRLLVNVLSQYPNKEHNHEHAYLLEDKKSFQKRNGLAIADLPDVPDRPDKSGAIISL